MLEIIKSFIRPEEPAQKGVVAGQYYERIGACNQCGKCCSHIYLVYGQQTISSLEMFEAVKEKNPEYHYFKPLPFQDDPDGILFQCIHLQANKSCGIYQNRPDFCKKYPSEHSILMGGKLAEGCGYQFKLLRSFQDVLKQLNQTEALSSQKTEHLSEP